MHSHLGTSLTQTLSNSELPGVLSDIGEAAFDTLLADGVFKDIPFIGSFIALVKTGFNIKDYFFAKKVVIFLNAMSSMPQVEREQLVQKLELDKKFRQNVGETIIELLSRIDGDVKPQCVAIALKHYASGKIDAVELLRLNNAIERFMFCDYLKLDMLCDGMNPFGDQDDPVASNFINAGLCYVESGYGAGGVKANALCEKFRNIAKEAQPSAQPS